MTDTKDNKKVEEVLDDKNLDNVTGGTNQPSPNDRKKNPSDNNFLKAYNLFQLYLSRLYIE